MTTSPASRAVTSLETVLRILAGIFVLGALLYQVGPLWNRTSGFFQTLPFVSNSIVKVSLLLCICLYAAGDLIRRKGLVLILIIAHAVSVVAMLIVLLVGDTSRIVDPGIGGPQPVGRVLWGAIALDGVIMVLLLLLYLPANRALSSVEWPSEPSEWLTPAEQWLRRLLILLTVVFVIGAIGYEVAPLIGLAPDLVRELPFVTNSVVKVSTLAMLCGYVAAALRPRMALVGPIITVHFVSVVAQAIYLILVPQSQLAEVYTVAGRLMPMRQILIGAMVLDGVIGVLLFALYYAAWQSRLKSEFFRPLEFRTLTALTEVMIAGHQEAIPPEAAARNVDQALARLRTERKGSFRIALAVIHYWPLFSLYPPLPELRPGLQVPLHPGSLPPRFRAPPALAPDPHRRPDLHPGRPPALGAGLLQRFEGPVGDSFQALHGASPGSGTSLAASQVPTARRGAAVGSQRGDSRNGRLRHRLRCGRCDRRLHHGRAGPQGAPGGAR